MPIPYSVERAKMWQCDFTYRTCPQGMVHTRVRWSIDSLNHAIMQSSLRTRQILIEICEQLLKLNKVAYFSNHHLGTAKSK